VSGEQQCADEHAPECPAAIHDAGGPHYDPNHRFARDGEASDGTVFYKCVRCGEEYEA